MSACFLGVRILVALAAAAAAAPAGVAIVDGEARRLTAREITAGRLHGAEAVWVWSAATPPRRSAGEVLHAALFAAPAGEVTVRIVAPSVVLPARLIAAPIAMWNEVPENLLPRWPVSSSGRVALPRDADEDWRLRLLGDQGVGGWWVDVAASESRVVLPAVEASDRSFVVLAADGSLLEDATIELRSAGDGLSRAQRLAHRNSGLNGEVVWPSVSDGDVQVVALAPERPPLVVSGALHELPRTLILPPGIALAGRVVDEGGRPLEGASVVAGSFVGASEPVAALAQAVTDAEGRWRIAGLTAATELALIVEKDGYARRREPIAARRTDLDLGDLQLATERRIELRTLSGRNGQPLVGASVLCAGFPAGSTDRDGTLELTGLPPHRPLPASVDAEGHLPWEGTIPTGTAVHQVTLRPAHSVTGRLLAADGAPAVDGQARLDGTAGSFSISPLAADGGFTLDLEPDRPAILVLSSRTAGEVRISVAAGAAGESTDLGDVQAPAGLTVVGQLVREADGMPIAAADVWTLPAANPLLAWARGDRRATTSGREGRFRLSGLPFVPQTLQVEAPSLARRYVPVTPRPGEAEVDLGVVELVAGAVVRVETAEASRVTVRLDLGGRWLESEMLTAPAVGGRATLHRVPEGRFGLSVVRDGDVICKTEVQVPSGPDEVEVQCVEENGRVRGTAWSDGRKVEAGHLVWRSAGNGMPGVILRRSGPLGLQRDDVFWGRRPDVVVEVGPEGRFTTGEILAGTWRVTLQDGAGGVSEPQTVEVAPDAGEREIQLHFAGTAITGRVIDGDGRTVAGARVIDRSGGAFALSGAQGGFRLPASPDHTARLQASLGDARSEVLEVSPLDASQEVTLVLVEETGEPVAVRVVDPSGSPATGAIVFFEVAGRGLTLATTGPGGEAPMPTTAGGSVRAAAHADGRWGFAGWQNGGETVEIVLGEGGSLRLTSRDGTALAIDAPGGWELGALFLRLGRRLSLAAGGELTIPGLPPGLYSVRSGAESWVAQVEAGNVERVDLP